LAVAGVGSLAWLEAGFVFSCEGIQGERGDTDEDGSEEGIPEAVDVESCDQLADEGEQEGVNDDDVEAEGEDDEGEGDEQEEGAEEGIEDTEEEGCGEQVFPIIEIDAGQDSGGDHDGEGGYQPAMEEPQERGFEGWCWLVSVHVVGG
jgi:hypothetical protein